MGPTISTFQLTRVIDGQNPKNLGHKVNSFAYEYGAWVDEENGYLYFNSFRRGSSDIYRIPLADLEVFRELDQ